MTNILIVDDEQQNIVAIIDRIRLTDEILHWNVESCNSFAEAIVKIQSIYDSGSEIDLVLTDMIMEREDSGIDLIKAANSIDPRIMSILFTASESNIDRHSIFDIGAFEVVEKNKIGTSR